LKHAWQYYFLLRKDEFHVGDFNQILNNMIQSVEWGLEKSDRKNWFGSRSQYLFVFFVQIEIFLLAYILATKRPEVP